MPERGPVIRQWEQVLVMLHSLNDQGRKWLPNLRTSHPERDPEAPPLDDVTAGKAAWRLFSYLSRSEIYPAHWELVIERISEAAAILHRLYIALKRDELCEKCAAILTDSNGFRDYIPTLHTAKVWVAHEDLDRWIEQVGKNGGAKAVEEALDTRHHCLTHRNRVWVQWYDEGWKPAYEETIRRAAEVAS